MPKRKLTRSFEQFAEILAGRPQPKNKIARAFEKAAAWAVTRLPVAIANRTAFKTRWYNRNNHYKFENGQQLVRRDDTEPNKNLRVCEIVGFEPSTKEWLRDYYAVRMQGDTEGVWKMPKRVIERGYRPYRGPKAP